jgi:hypothetical protein
MLTESEIRPKFYTTLTKKLINRSLFLYIYLLYILNIIYIYITSLTHKRAVRSTESDGVMFALLYSPPCPHV